MNIRTIIINIISYLIYFFHNRKTTCFLLSAHIFVHLYMNRACSRGASLLVIKCVYKLAIAHAYNKSIPIYLLFSIIEII